MGFDYAAALLRDTDVQAVTAVAIIMGSQSDWPTMRGAAETLEALGVGYEARIVSAHPTGSWRLPKARRMPAFASSSPAPAGRRTCLA